MVNLHKFREKYVGKKVIVKKFGGLNPEYALCDDADETYAYFSNGLPKPMDTNGYSAALHEEIEKLDKYDAIYKYGIRKFNINHKDIRNIEVLLAQDEKEELIRKVLNLPEDK